MSKTEPAGLLSKVVSFVRRPGGVGGDADSLETDRDSNYNKQMLKEMIERKRRNDFVRRREFDQLRKLRKRESVSGEEITGRQSFFQSSLPSRPDDRAITLKKIDEIEAQMSMQWWKTKQGDSATPPTTVTQPSQFSATDGGAASAAARAAATDRPAVPPSTTAGSPSSAPGRTPALEPLEFDVSGPHLPPDAIPVLTDPVLDERLSGDAHAPTVPAAMEQEPAEATAGYPETVPASIGGPPVLDDVVFPELEGVDDDVPLSASDMPYASDPSAQPYGAPIAPAVAAVPAAPVFQPFVHRPELEEAAIRFANGDHAGAESGLQELLAHESPLCDEPDVWMTLLDLYRATGQHDRFDNVAIDFAVRFGRSAPLWFSLPEMLGLPFTPAAVNPGGTVPRAFQWMAPIVLLGTSVVALQASLARSPAPWTLNWKMLNSMDASAVGLLADQFSRLADTAAAVHFIAADNLDRVLREQTVPDDPSVDVHWWRLRMETLRLRGRMEEFESVALDYCITFEVSPPSWQAVRCEYVEIKDADTSGGGADAATVPAALSDAESGPMDLYGVSQPAPLAPAVELSGHIVGDAQAALASLEGSSQPGRPLVVSCERLARVDFSAAGSVLNWAAERQAEGCHVQFVHMPRLVAVFFNVIGINEHAAVMPRKD